MTITEAQVTKINDSEWSVVGSKGVLYPVTRKANGRLYCPCDGYYFRKICRHVVAVEKTLPGGREHGFLLAAINFNHLGYHVIPVEPRGKCPLVRWLDFQTVKPTISQICDWWSKWPDANVGLVIANGQFVIDLDGGDEAEALLVAAGIEIPADAPRVRTRSGYHIYLQSPTKRNDRIGFLKSATPLAEQSLTPGGKQRHAQVDARARGIIIAPPSIHPSGHVYEWITPLKEQDQPPTTRE